MTSILDQFTLPLLRWHALHGRKNLPWKEPVDGYRVWLSEIMLQQTQVKTVIPYYLRFIERFPDIQALAEASEDEILSLWSGLGYYSRGRNLHKTAGIISKEFHGQFPQDVHTLMKLPGVGASTAAAIASQAFNQPAAIMDGNVKRVLSRYFLVEGTSGQTTKTLWELAQKCMSVDNPADYTQAIMDLGATCCTQKNPKCITCPLHKNCLANIHGLTAEYPHKKPKKTIPNQYQQFLLIHQQDHGIYLEKRPANGIWGGLWCPPHIDCDIDPTLHIQNNYPFEVIELLPLLNLKHTFTHFRLHINALSVEIKSVADSSLELKGCWFSPTETIKLGLAKPISDMIKKFQSPQH
jgi:A/G-specific adenine glycosylase